MALCWLILVSHRGAFQLCKFNYQDCRGSVAQAAADVGFPLGVRVRKTLRRGARRRWHILISDDLWKFSEVLFPVRGTIDAP